MSATAVKEPDSEVDLYSKTLKLNEICGETLTFREKAEIYCRRSEALIRIEELQQALKDAYCSTKADSSFDEVNII